MARILPLVVCSVAGRDPAPDREAVERGRKALETRSFNQPVWSDKAYDTAWKFWEQGLKEQPANYPEKLRDRYGLHPAPYANDGLPMGLRKSLFAFSKGISVDCLVCHGGSIMGKSYVGLGNSTPDIQAQFDELNWASGRKMSTPFTFTNVRGTSEAGGMGVFLLGHLNPDLSIRLQRVELGLRDDLCEDPPAWWLMKKKKTMYHTGGGDARSVRSLMQFMMGPLNTRATFDKEEEIFRDVQAFLSSATAKTFDIDRQKAAAERSCSKSLFQNAGTYGDNWTCRIGSSSSEAAPTGSGTQHALSAAVTTTPAGSPRKGRLADGLTRPSSIGYQVPLGGIWATAYLHNGSVPTV